MNQLMEAAAEGFGHPPFQKKSAGKKRHKNPRKIVVKKIVQSWLNITFSITMVFVRHALYRTMGIIWLARKKFSKKIIILQNVR